MKLILINNYNLDIHNNEKEAKSFVKEVLKNINIFINILTKKVIKEKKYIELYNKLCYDLYTKYFNLINDLILKKYLNTRIDNNDNYNLINNFKKILNIECISKYENLLSSDFNEEYKQNLLNLINFAYLSFENEIISNETFSIIINKLFNKYETKEFFEHKYYFLYLIIHFLIKIKNNKYFKDSNNFIDKVHFIIKHDIKKIKKIKLSKFLKVKIEEFINIFSKKILIKTEDTKELNIIKQYDFLILKYFKNIELEDIIRNFIDASNDSNINEENIFYYKSYIKYIIEQISDKLSLSKLRIFHNKMLLIFSEINQICKQNDYIFEIIGYLVYSLIENELCDVFDMNIFINKDERSKINICKIIKYIILSSENNIIKNKKYFEDFKNLELFKGNNLFNDYINGDINKITSNLQ